jgi:hypothetical protein
MWHGEGGGLGELCCSALHPQLQEPITAIDFDPLEEAIWTGTEGGLVAQLLSPTLERYCTVPAHQDRVVDLRAVGEAAVSLSSGELCVHSSGGAPRLTYADEVRCRLPPAASALECALLNVAAQCCSCCTVLEF